MGSCFYQVTTDIGLSFYNALFLATCFFLKSDKFLAVCRTTS